jgi:hypothetical protein
MPGAYCFFLSYDMEVSVTRAPIFIDSFFDGGGGGDQYPGTTPQVGQVRTGYTPAGADQFASVGPRGDQMFGGMAGRSLSSVLRSEFAGGTSVGGGMIVPSATEGGIPAGMSPHFLDGVTVIVDPHIPHQRTELEIGGAKQFSAQAVQAAAALIPNAFSVQEKRFRASAAYRMIGEAEQAGEFVEQVGIAPDEEDLRLSQKDRDAGVKAAQQQQPANRVRVVQGAPPVRAAANRTIATPVGQPTPTPQINRPVRSLTAAATQQAAPATAARQSQQAAAAQPAVPAHPTKLVHFELQFFNARGEPVPMNQDAYFHDVVMAEDRTAILLAWKQGCPAPKWLPPSGESAPQIALLLDGTNEAHVVSVMPISYVFQGYELTQLVITQSGEI